MDEGTATLIGVVVGAALTGAGTLVKDLIQRRQDRNTIAAAIAAEISAVLTSAQMKQMPQYFSALIPQLRSATPPAPPWIYFDASYESRPVMVAHLDRIGLLGPSLARRVVTFHALYDAVRLEAKVLAAGAHNNDPKRAADHIERALALWDRTNALAQPLVVGLLALSGEQPEQ